MSPVQYVPNENLNIKVTFCFHLVWLVCLWILTKIGSNVFKPWFLSYFVKEFTKLVLHSPCAMLGHIESCYLGSKFDWSHEKNLVKPYQETSANYFHWYLKKPGAFLLKFERNNFPTFSLKRHWRFPYWITYSPFQFNKFDEINCSWPSLLIYNCAKRYAVVRTS